MSVSALGRWAAVLLASAAPLPIAYAASAAENIRHLAGCFEVTYEFVEDGTHDSLSPDYELGPVIEWVGHRKQSDDAHVLPHVSINKRGDPVPHWHEIWREDERAGAWTQVRRGAPDAESGELRYRCTAPWQMNQWNCDAGPSPKPFRDSGAPFGFERDDYARIDRHNTILVTGNGWVQNERNRKITAEGEVVSYKLGWILYRRVTAERCQAAADPAGVRALMFSGDTVDCAMITPAQESGPAPPVPRMPAEALRPTGSQAGGRAPRA